MDATDISQSGASARYHGRERRSAHRRRLQETAQLRMSGGDGAGKWQLSGVVLNATPRGLACRIPASRLSDLSAKGGALQVDFDLEAGLPRFELLAEVRNVTEAGTPGYYVVGMEFVCDPSTKGERERLQAALDAVNAEGKGQAI